MNGFDLGEGRTRSAEGRRFDTGQLHNPANAGTRWPDGPSLEGPFLSRDLEHRACAAMHLLHHFAPNVVL